MTLEASGSLSIGGTVLGRSINLQVGRAFDQESSLNDGDLRALAEIITGNISISDFYGKPGGILSLLYAIANPSAYSTPAWDRFGSAVAISGDYAVVGTPLEGSSGGSSSGVVYVFRVSTGELVHTLYNPNVYSTTYNDYFGYSVAINENYIAAGAIYEQSYTGSVYVFDIITGSLIRTMVGYTASGRFGHAVALFGDSVLVSAVDDNISGEVFLLDILTGALIHTFDNPNIWGTVTNDLFGHSVDLSENYVVIGAPTESITGYSYSGAVYIFDKNTGSLLHSIDDPNIYSTPDNDKFGRSVAISGDNIVIGSVGEEYNASGTCYVYDAPTGSIIFNIPYPQPLNPYNNNFGESVSIDGDYFVVGAPTDNTGGYSYIFNVTSGDLLHSIEDPTMYGSPTDDRFGCSVGISGKRVIVGANWEDMVGYTYTGSIYLFGF